MESEPLDSLTNLVTGEVDRQLKERNDVIDTMKAQMTKVLKEFEDMTWNVQAKRSWMKSIAKSRDISPTNVSGSIHPVVTAGNIVVPPPRLPKLSPGLKKKKKHQHIQLSRNISGSLPHSHADGSSDARSPDGKLVFDKKLPRVANMDKRVDGLQSMLASQYKQSMYERALLRYPQCRSNVFAPSVYDDTPISGSDASVLGQAAPQSTLELDFVYGFHNGVAASSVSQVSSNNTNSSCTGNLFYLSTGEILWFTAALVILYRKENNTQRIFREHSNQVTCVGLHPNQHIVASGQAGRETFLLVWNAKDEQLGKRFTCLPGHTVAVRSISFSHDGKLIASLGGDMYNTICIHDWREQTLLATARGHSFRVHAVVFNPYQAYGRPETRREKKPGQALHDDDVCYTLVSYGVRHIRFWTLTKTEYVAPIHEENEDSAFYGCAFGGPVRLRPTTPHEKMWKLEGNVPSFHGRLDVQDFTCVTFVDDSPPLYMYDEHTKELVATRNNDHSLGRIVAGTAKGDLCVFWQPRKSPDIDATQMQNKSTEPAKWWEIPDEYTDAEINELILEKIAFEPSARLVEVVPHDLETGNRFKISKQAQAEIDGIMKRMAMKPNSSALHARLNELKYSGAFAHQGTAFQVAYCKKNNLVLSCGSDGKLLLWRCIMQKPMRVPGVNTLGVYTPLTESFSEGIHSLVPFDDEAEVLELPTLLPGENSLSMGSSGAAKPTSVAWKEDGKTVLVGTSTSCIWELVVATREWRLIFEARNGAIAGCTSHPNKYEVATVSQDGFLSIWDLRQHVCKRRCHLGSHMGTAGVRAVCMEFQPFGDEIAIGMSNGTLLIVNYNDLKVIVKKSIKAHSTGSTADLHNGVMMAPPISQLKYCSQGNLLAVGARDTFIYIYDVTNGYRKLHVCEGHSSAVTHLTWSIEGDTLQSNATDGEILHWSVGSTKGNIKQITDAFSVRDTQWAKWTCVFGWPTSGIWSEDMTSLTDVSCVCTTGAIGKARAEDETSLHANVPGSEHLMAVACRSSIHLFKWPAFRGAKWRTFAAHSSPITALCFSFNDGYLLSVGGDDGTLLQWKCVTSSPPNNTMGDATSPISKRKLNLQLSYSDDDNGQVIASSPSPVPPPKEERGYGGQRSPRRHPRQYRGHQELDEEAGSNSSETGRGDDDFSASPQNDQDSPTKIDTVVPVDTRDSILQVRVKHDFRAENADELSLRSEELIRVLSKVNNDWWMGENCDGMKGIFPASYVEEQYPTGESAVFPTQITYEEEDEAAATVEDTSIVEAES